MAALARRTRCNIMLLMLNTLHRSRHEASTARPHIWHVARRLHDHSLAYRKRPDIQFIHHLRRAAHRFLRRNTLDISCHDFSNRLHKNAPMFDRRDAILRHSIQIKWIRVRQSSCRNPASTKKKGLRKRNPEPLGYKTCSARAAAAALHTRAIHHYILQILSVRPFQYASRSSRLSVFPAALRGNVSMITTSLTRW